MAPGEGLSVDRGVDRRPEKSQGDVCVHSIPREASLQAKRVLLTSVLLIIRRSSRVSWPPVACLQREALSAVAITRGEMLTLDERSRPWLSRAAVR